MAQKYIHIKNLFKRILEWMYNPTIKHTASDNKCFYTAIGVDGDNGQTKVQLGVGSGGLNHGVYSPAKGSYPAHWIIRTSKDSTDTRTVIENPSGNITLIPKSNSSRSDYNSGMVRIMKDVNTWDTTSKDDFRDLQLRSMTAYGNATVKGKTTTNSLDVKSDFTAKNITVTNKLTADTGNINNINSNKIIFKRSSYTEPLPVIQGNELKVEAFSLDAVRLFCDDYAFFGSNGGCDIELYNCNISQRDKHEAEGVACYIRNKKNTYTKTIKMKKADVDTHDFKFTWKNASKGYFPLSVTGYASNAIITSAWVKEYTSTSITIRAKVWTASALNDTKNKEVNVEANFDVVYAY